MDKKLLQSLSAIISRIPKKVSSMTKALLNNNAILLKYNALHFNIFSITVTPLKNKKKFLKHKDDY